MNISAIKKASKYLKLKYIHVKNIFSSFNQSNFRSDMIFWFFKMYNHYIFVDVFVWNVPKGYFWKDNMRVPSFNFYYIICNQS